MYTPKNVLQLSRAQHYPSESHQDRIDFVEGDPPVVKHGWVAVELL